MRMVQKLKSIFNMKKRYILPLIALAISSCNQQSFVLESKVFCFDTMVDIRLFEGEQEDIKKIEDILNYYDKISDNYLARDITNVYTLNHTNDEIEVSTELYNLLKTSTTVATQGARYFNVLAGSLSKRWKESLAQGQVLSQAAIEEELNKLDNSFLTLYPNNIVKRSGEAEIDLGGIAKGYTLDVIKEYLNSKEYKHYLIDGGSSSILLGEKQTSDGYFTVGINKVLSGAYLKAKNCFISTSGNNEQGVKIGDNTYSHIVNPETGSALTNYDAVIVVSDDGYLGDALSTSMMVSPLEYIKQVELENNVKTIVIKDNKIVHKHAGIEVFY